MCEIVLGHISGEPGTNAERFHLMAPYESDPRKWAKVHWTDQYSGKQYYITTTDQHGSRDTVRVKSYGDVLLEYEFHAEVKCADVDGHPSGKQTLGLLQRRHVTIDQIKYIGKESNGLEEVESGMVHSAEAVSTEYPDPRRDVWQTKILPALREAPRQLLIRESGMSRRALMDLCAGRRRPHRKNQQKLTSLLRRYDDSNQDSTIG
jgi:hypothetical protein